MDQLILPTLTKHNRSLLNAKSFPEKVNIGYVFADSCDDNVVTAVNNGVNVVVWTFITLPRVGEKIVVKADQVFCCFIYFYNLFCKDLNCFARIANQLDPKIVHMISSNQKHASFFYLIV